MSETDLYDPIKKTLERFGHIVTRVHSGKVKVRGGKIRSSPEYAQWRRSVFERDNYRCVACNAKGDLHADHIKPFAYFPELRIELSNGRALCPPCHALTDTYKSKARAWRPR